MLALLEREHELWTDDLDALAAIAMQLDDELAYGLAKSLRERAHMLKLLAMDLYDMELSSGLEAHVRFKVAYGRVVSSLQGVFSSAKPGWDEARIKRFTFSIMPFLHGVYPYTHLTEKQLEAMRAADIDEAGLDFERHGLHDDTAATSGTTIEEHANHSRHRSLPSR